MLPLKASASPRSEARISVQTKVLVPVLLFLVLIPAFIVTVGVNLSWRALDDTQRTLVVETVLGMFFSAAIVWFFVRRLTRMLRELRIKAEAVGRGDFSRRITRFSSDECGELAEAFNQMTANLLKSRFELEKAAETLGDTRAQLKQSEKLSAVGQFVAGVAHELNNPLTLVIGFSDLLMEAHVDEKIRPRLEIIAKSAHRCHKIVDNLLSFARQHTPHRKLTNLKETVDDVIELMAYDMKTSNIDVITDFPPNLPPVTADPHQLQQVFVNLIGNARQAIQGTRPDGRIIVRARSSAGFVRVEIADNGPGISPENIRRIFDPFFTTKPVGKGTGLGLSLVLGIVQEHGGRIDVESEVGRGATFIIELPIAPETAHSRPESALAPAKTRGPIKPPGSSGKVILVIDDEEWILTLARDLLGGNGHAVEPAISGESAVEAVEKRDFDAIVCDWKMPGMNGVQFYERLLDLKPHLAERVLFMSGNDLDEGFQTFLMQREKKCLAKPFPIEEFRDSVEKIISLSWSQSSQASRNTRVLTAPAR